MRQVELQTKDGHFVATVEITPFPDPGMPEVLTWGDRTFTFHERRKPAPWVYREAFAVVSLTESPGAPKWEPT
jgi:hypothetical protein